MKILLMVLLAGFAMNALADDSIVSGMAAASTVSVADTPKTSTVPPPYKAKKYIGGLFAHTFNPVFKESGKKVFIELVGPKAKDTDDEKIKQAVAELSRTVGMLSEEARKVLARDGINVVENKADADVAFEIVAAHFRYGHDITKHPIIVPYLGIASTDDWDDLQHKMKLQKPGAIPGIDAGAFHGPVVALITGGVRAVADHHSDDLIEDPSPVNQRLALVVEMYIKKNGEFAMEQRDWPAAQPENPSSYIYVKPDQLFADAVECIFSCIQVEKIKFF
jgi:hypothetical protein